MSVPSKLHEARFDSLDVPHKTHATLSIGYLRTTANPQGVSISLYWQRPNSILEVELLSSQIPVHAVFPEFAASATLPFSPPAVTTNSILPSLLAQYTTTKPPYLLGNVRIQVRISHQAAQSTDTFHVPSQDDVWHGHFALETYIHQSKGPIQIPVYQSGTQMETLS